MSLSLCGTSVANTGELSCDKSRGVAKKFFILNGTIASGDLISEQSFFDKLVANSKLSKDSGDKLFVLNEVQQIERTSEQNVTGTLGLGFSAVLREGRPAYTAKIFGGADLLKRLRRFNNQTVRLIEYDANGTAWAYKTGGNARGFQAKLFFSGNELATGSNVEEGIIDVGISILSVSEYKDNAFYADLTDFNVEDIVPLTDVSMEYVSHVSNVLKYKLSIAGSNIIESYNIGPGYGTAIAALAASFSAKSGAGTPATSLAITSMAYDATNKLLAVTYDNTAYGTASTNIMLIPPTPAQLDAGDVVGIELLQVIHAKPA